MKVFAAIVVGLTVSIGSHAQTRPSPLKGGAEFQGADNQALEKDAFANPGMLWVTRGEALWSRPRGEAKVACSGCHTHESMRGVAARYPRHDPSLGRVVNLEGRANACVEKKQRAPRLAPESEELLALTAYLSRQSLGVPIEVSIEGPANSVFEKGRSLYHERIGQLQLACTHCHDANWGQHLLAEKVSQGQPDGWPAYRLEWQSLASLERRLRACFFGVRAEMPEYGSDDLVALELYLGWRAQGLPMSVPGVRR